MSYANAGQQLDVFTKRQFPANKAVTPPLNVKNKGKLKGTIKYTIPKGLYTTYALTLASVFYTFFGFKGS